MAEGAAEPGARTFCDVCRLVEQGPCRGRGPALRGLACGRVEPGLTNRVPGLPFGKTRDVPNLVALIILAGVAAAETDRYLWTGDLEDSGEAARSVSSAAP